MDLYLIRHTRPDIEAGVCYGSLDVPLASTHPKECAAVVARLPQIEAVRSSPLTRCRVLAEAIAAETDVRPSFDERLRELDFGEWEGRRWDAIERSQSASWAADYWNVAPPGGETYRSLHGRVSEALDELVARKLRRVAIVTHAGPIRAALAHCLGFDSKNYPRTELTYGAVNLLRAKGSAWQVEFLNG